MPGACGGRVIEHGTRDITKARGESVQGGAVGMDYNEWWWNEMAGYQARRRRSELLLPHDGARLPLLLVLVLVLVLVGAPALATIVVALFR